MEILKNFYKFQMNSIISIILVYSPEDILNYLSQKLNYNNPLDNLEFEDIFNIKIP